MPTSPLWLHWFEFKMVEWDLKKKIYELLAYFQLFSGQLFL